MAPFGSRVWRLAGARARDVAPMAPFATTLANDNDQGRFGHLIDEPHRCGTPLGPLGPDRDRPGKVPDSPDSRCQSPGMALWSPESGRYVRSSSNRCPKRP